MQLFPHSLRLYIVWNGGDWVRFYNDEDLKLVDGIINREDSAFELLMNKYGDRLLKVCCLILKEASLGEDALQEIFIQIYKSIFSFNHKSSLYTWIYKIAINKCRDIQRKQDNYYVCLETELIAASTDLELETLEQLERASIRELVYRLSPIYREIVILFYFEDLSIKEISTILEEKENTVKSRLLRARNILKDEFVKEGLTYEG
jgi:RNA polymerase sigma-70 factor, ECF subfamily